MRYLTIFAIIVFVLTIGAAGYILFWENDSQPRESTGSIASFEQCADAGYPILDSYPEQCETPDGKRFVRNLSEEELVGVIAPIIVEGMFICLPHWETEGPITLECAFGLRDDEGNYYVLYDSDPMTGNLSTVPTDTRIEVFGIFTPGSHERYQSIGVIEIEEVFPVE